MTASSPATHARAEPDDRDASEDHESVPVTIGYGALEDNGSFTFSWQRLFMFAGASCQLLLVRNDAWSLLTSPPAADLYGLEHVEATVCA